MSLQDDRELAHRLLMLDRASLIRRAEELSDAGVELLETAVKALCAERQTVIAGPLEMVVAQRVQARETSAERSAQLHEASKGLEAEVGELESELREGDASMGTIPALFACTVLSVGTYVRGGDTDVVWSFCVGLTPTLSYLLGRRSSTLPATRRARVASLVLTASIAALVAGLVLTSVDDWTTRGVLFATYLAAAGLGVADDDPDPGPIRYWLLVARAHRRRRALRAAKAAAARGDSDLAEAKSAVEEAQAELKHAEAYFPAQEYSVIAGVKLASGLGGNPP